MSCRNAVYTLEIQFTKFDTSRAPQLTTISLRAHIREPTDCAGWYDTAWLQFS
jgi:hypothetical protein